MGDALHPGMRRATEHSAGLRRVIPYSEVGCRKTPSPIVESKPGRKPERCHNRVHQKVVTGSGSQYVIDTVEWPLQRVRGRDEQEDLEVAAAATLQRDGETLQLWRVLVLEVGRRAVFDVAPLRPDAVWTRRTTTFVESIIELPSLDSADLAADR